MSLCDTCTKPGACCRDFLLFHAGNEPATDWIDGPSEFKSLPMFSRGRIDGEIGETSDGRQYAVHRYSCRNLGDDGRCMDYENRPQLCRDYEPGSSGLCVMYKPPEPL